MLGIHYTVTSLCFYQESIPGASTILLHISDRVYLFTDCHIYANKQNHQDMHYVLQDNTLRHKNTNLCIELSEDGTKIEMKPCTGIDRQIFYWKRKLPDSEAKKYDSNLGMHKMR